jgi:MinD-like ATPase involved in chromosome partitioning or flagellar assembly
MATKILMTCGGKGGTGRSNYIKFPICYLQDCGIEPYLIDADDENPTLSRYFPQALRIEPKKIKSYDLIIEIAEKGEQRIIVVDLKAGVGGAMLQWVSDLPFSELGELGIQIVLIPVITSSPDSSYSLLQWANFFGKRVKYMVVRNLKDSDAIGLDPKSVLLAGYDDTVQAAEFKRRYRPCEIIMPGLDPEYMAELERCNLTIRDVLAKKPSVPPTLNSLMVRSKLRNYQAMIFEQLHANRHLLLPE